MYRSYQKDPFFYQHRPTEVRRRPWAPSPVVIGIAAIILFVGGLVVRDQIRSKLVDDAVSVSTSSASASVTSGTVDFTLARQFYDPLAFFENSYTSHLNYAFLQQYDAVIEPYQPMYLYLYDTEAQKQSYRFTVCPTASSASENDCQEGYISTSDQDSSKKAVQFACTPFSAYTISVEQVDAAALSLPYWDFTIDVAENRNAWESVILSSDTYGAMSLPSNISHGFTYTEDAMDDGRVQDSRWADLKVEQNIWYDDLRYSYGYLRAPWNLNPSPYITRYAFSFKNKLTFPDCASHYDVLQYDDMMDFFATIANSPHSKAHTVLGGFYGCDAFQTLIDQGYIANNENARVLCSFWSFYVKEFWRRNFITPDRSCALPDTTRPRGATIATFSSTAKMTTTTATAEASASCGFTCVAGQEDDMLDFLFEQSHLNIDTTTNPTGARAAVLQFICNSSDGTSTGRSYGSQIFTGDHLESASPADPSFWVIHPTIERLFHAKLMSGGFVTDYWPIHVNESQSTYVCAKNACYNATTGSYDYHTDCCYGHYRDDQTMDADVGSRAAYTGATNYATFQATNPTSIETYQMPYIYDTFTWDHCTASSGLDLVSLLQDLHTDGVSRSTAAASKTNTNYPRKVYPPESQRQMQAHKVYVLAKNQKIVEKHRQSQQQQLPTAATDPQPKEKKVTTCLLGDVLMGVRGGYRMIRATHGVHSGGYFWEAMILPSSHAEAHFRIGWSTRQGELQAPVGYDAYSYAYRDVSGSKVYNSIRDDHYGASFGPGDVIGCYIYLDDNTLNNKMIFYKNGISQGIAFQGPEIKPGIYFPAISIFMQGNVRVNFGPKYIVGHQLTGSVQPVSELQPFHPRDRQVHDREVLELQATFRSLHEPRIPPPTTTEPSNNNDDDASPPSSTLPVSNKTDEKETTTASSEEVGLSERSSTTPSSSS
eukprot:gene3082-2258_t